MYFEHIFSWHSACLSVAFISFTTSRYFTEKQEAMRRTMRDYNDKSVVSVPQDAVQRRLLNS